MSQTITLSKPIMVEGIETREITLREPTVKDLRAVDSIVGEMAQNVALVSRLTDIPAPALDAMLASDYGRVQLLVATFLGVGQATGEN